MRLLWVNFESGHLPGQILVVCVQADLQGNCLAWTARRCHSVPKLHACMKHKLHAFGTKRRPFMSEFKVRTAACLKRRCVVSGSPVSGPNCQTKHMTSNNFRPWQLFLGFPKQPTSCNLTCTLHVLSLEFLLWITFDECWPWVINKHQRFHEDPHV